ncbi:MAG: DUF3987 domain-containing protein [Bacteroidaceae bacterium]|nr:DUF3987 domain-containing protein [Bacteroidaceae bacterium]
MSCYQIIIQDGRKVCRPVQNREEYLALRGSKANVANRVMAGLGNESAKKNLVQMNYSCLPNDDGSLRGSTRMSTAVGMDIDHIPASVMEGVKQTILQKKDELGLLMLELSARGGGYHLAFRRRPELSQEENLRWASDLLGVEYDKGAKDITRVFFTTTASEEDLIYLDDEIFQIEEVESVECSVESQFKKLKVESTENSKLATDSKLSTLNSKLEYNSIPYSIIVNALLERFGFEDGYVPEGVRNTTLYKLARQLRYICDFNPLQLQAVLPSWGLSDEEVRSTIQSAIGSTRSQDFPYDLNAVMRSITKPDLSTTAKRQEYLQRLNPLPKKMPWLFDYIYRRYGRNGRSALIAALPMLGTLLGRFECKYLDGRKHRPVFMVVICGHAGSGKGFLADMQDWLLKPVIEDDEKGRAELLAYKKESEKKKGAKQLPDKPEPCIRVLNATSSNGFLMERAQSSLGQPLCVITEEIDESARSNKNGAWADKSDIYRKAFDGANWGQDYLIYSGSVHIFVNLLFAGTYVSIRNYFNNVENGLMTRFFFTEMARDCGKNVEVRKDIETNDDVRAAKEVQRLYEQGSTTDLQAPENIISFALPKAKKDAYDFNEEKIAEWEASGPDEEHRDEAIDLLRRRSAVILFRASQVCYALERNRETKVGREMARWFANEIFLNQYIMFADAINESSRQNDAIQRKQDLAASRIARNDALTKLLGELPEEFSRTDLKEVLIKKGLNPECSRTYTGRMIERELIMTCGKLFKKIPPKV